MSTGFMIATVLPPQMAVLGWGGLEWLLIFTLVLILVSSAGFRSALYSRDPQAATQRSSRRADWRDALLLWLGEGFGVGRIPLAPGTFGSVVGLVWMLALAATQSVWGYGLGLLAGLAVSVWLCGAAERLLGVHDPGSVVMDEIAAAPLCFAGWIGHRLWLTGEMPSLDLLASGRGWLVLLTGFAAFRLFDIAKPWPVRQSQGLPGGWGIVVDDALAAVYANVVWLPLVWLGWR